jgi:hypothetical protein
MRLDMLLLPSLKELQIISFNVVKSNNSEKDKSPSLWERLDSSPPPPPNNQNKENESNGQTRKLLSHLPMRQMASMLRIIMSLGIIIEAFSTI